MPLLLFPDKQNIEHLHLALSTVVGGLVLASAVESHFDTLGLDILQDHGAVTQRTQEAVFDELKQLGIGDLDIPRQVPRQVDHRHDALVALQLVPLVPLDGEVVLPRCERPHVPRDVVTPPDCLDPVDAARVDPDQVPGSL